MLEPIINLENTVSDLMVRVVSNRQTNSIISGIHSKHTYLKNGLNYHDTLKNLNDFNLNVLQWNDSEMLWKFNGQHVYHIDITHKFRDKLNQFKDFQLSINLQVGGFNFDDQELSQQDVYDWNISALIIDYVRVY